MKKILVCDDDTAIREVVGMVIESEFDNEIVYACNAKEGIECLKKDINIGLIICDYNMPGGKGSNVFAYNSEALNIPFMMLTGDMNESFSDIENFKTNPLNVVIHKPWDEDFLFDSIRAVIEHKDQIIAESEEYEAAIYKKVRTAVLIKYTIDGIKFFKKINEIDFKEVAENEFRNTEQYLLDNPFTYITNESFKLLLEAVNSRFTNYRTTLKNSSLSTIFNISEAVMDKLIINADSIDMSIEEIEDLSQAASNEVENIKKELEIKDIIEKSFLESDYYEGHSLLTMQIAFKLITSLGFAQPQLIAKVVQASILHDSLFENKNLSSINTMAQLKAAKLNEEEKQLVLSHGKEFANYFRKFSWISDDVITGIKEHHNRRDSDGLTQPINPVEVTTFSVIFNLSFQCADHIFQFGHSGESLDKLIGLLNKYYQVGNYKFAANKLVQLFS